MQESSMYNKEKIQNTHKDVYEHFFLNHQIVLSAHNVIDRWNGIGESFNNFKIKQKVSAKTFCGINLNTSGKIQIREVFQYEGLENNFSKISFEQFSSEAKRVKEYLEKYIDFQWGNGVGMEISFLCEIPKGHGFGTVDIISLLLIYGIQYIVGNIDDNHLKEYTTFTASEKFNEIYYEAWTLSDIFNRGKSTGWDVYVSLSQESMPVVYISKNIAESPENENDSEKSRTYKENIIEFLGLEEQTELPIDFGVLYFGMEYDEEYIYEIGQNYKNSINTLQAYIMEKLKKKWMSDNKFYFGKFNYENFYDNFIEVWTILHLKLLRSFEQIIKKKHENTTIEEFINNINELWLFATIIESNNTFIGEIKKTFNALKLFDTEKIGICPLTLGKAGGSFLFVTPYQKSRKTINKLVETYNFAWVKTHLEYASRSDGYIKEGVQILQDLNKNIFSEYLQSWSVIYKDNQGKKYMWDYDTIIQQEQEWIILDKIANKIYINGQALTSKNLVSQSSTIEILDILIDAMGKSIDSKQLPSSSYTKQRNQMLGKIILPLKELTKSMLGKEINLECTWSLYQFYIKLDEKVIKIGVIKQV